MKKFLLILLLVIASTSHGQFIRDETIPSKYTVNAHADSGNVLVTNGWVAGCTLIVDLGAFANKHHFSPEFSALNVRYDTSAIANTDSPMYHRGKLPRLDIKWGMMDNKNRLLVKADSVWNTLAESIAYDTTINFNMTDSLHIAEKYIFIVYPDDDSLVADTTTVDSFTTAGYGRGIINQRRRYNVELQFLSY